MFLVLVPLGYIAYKLQWNAIAVFTLVRAFAPAAAIVLAAAAHSLPACATALSGASAVCLRRCGSTAMCLPARQHAKPSTHCWLHHQSRHRACCCKVTCLRTMQQPAPLCFQATCHMQNFCGIIPLALILGDVTEDLALRSGEVIGGLVNATFGNVVELILSCVALARRKRR